MTLFHRCSVEMRGEEIITCDDLPAAVMGDDAAFARLYRDTQPRLLRYARVLVGSDAEDVTAEAWFQIARDIRTFSGELDDFRGWAARIVRNRAIDQVRARARRPIHSAGLDDLLERPGSLDTESAAYENISTESAIALIATLPRDQAEAVLLRVVMGLDAPTAAKVLGKRPGAVRTAAHRGLRASALMLDESGYGRHRDGRE